MAFAFWPCAVSSRGKMDLYRCGYYLPKPTSLRKTDHSSRRPARLEQSNPSLSLLLPPACYHRRRQSTPPKPASLTTTRCTPWTSAQPLRRDDKLSLRFSSGFY